MRRLAIVCLKNGSPQRETILILNGLADDDEQDAELRKTAKAVAAALTKRAKQKLGSTEPRGSGDAPLVGRDHGLALRLGDDAARRRDARGARGSLRAAGRLRAPHAGPALRVRRLGGGARAAGDDRRRGRRRAPARDGRGEDGAAGARRPGRVEDAEGDGLAALDRADARGRPGRDAGDRPRRRGQRGAARRGDRRALGRRACASGSRRYRAEQTEAVLAHPDPGRVTA